MSNGKSKTGNGQGDLWGGWKSGLRLLCCAVGVMGVWIWSSQACDPPPTDEPTTKPCCCDKDCAGNLIHKICDNGLSCADCSQGPVNRASGIVLEETQDLMLPGFVNWSHTRSYNSRMKAADGWVLRDTQGKRWEAGASTAYLWRDDNSDITLHWGAENTVFFKYHADSSTWRAQRGSQAKLTREQYYLGQQDQTYYYVVRLANSSEVLLFKAYGSQLILYRVTDRYNQKQTTYNYDPNTVDGRVTSITTSQGWEVSFRHLTAQTNEGRHNWIVVRNDSNVPRSGAVYVYHEGHHVDCGSGGDLILVHACTDLAGAGTVNGPVAAEATSITLADDRNAPNSYTYNNGALADCMLIIAEGGNAGHIRKISSNTGNAVTLASGFSSSISDGTSYMVVRGSIKTTHYRYYNTGSSYGQANQVKLVLEPAAVERALAMPNSVLSSAGDLLGKSDTDHLDSDDNTSADTVTDYADRVFTYYTSNLRTDQGAVDTPWGGSDDLQSMYGGSDLDETAGTGRVWTELVRNSCTSCGGGVGGGVKFTYFYMKINQGPDPTRNMVTTITVEDVTATDQDPDDVKLYRKVFGLNPDGVQLREALIVDPDTPKYWCSSTLVGIADKEMNQVKERRMPSAHTCVDTDAVKTFLDPTGNSGANDTNTVHASQGVIHCYYYWHDDGESYPNYYLCDTTVKQGRTGTEHVVESSDFGDGADKKLPTATYAYSSAVAYQAGGGHRDNGIQTTYAYSFHDPSDEHQLKTKTVTSPSISAGENGPDASFVMRREYYDANGRLRWVKDGEGRVTYYAYHPNFGTLAYQMVDVDTDGPAGGGLPGEITSGSEGKWQAWTENGGAAPTNFTNTDNNALQLVSKIEYDDQGRQNKFEDPEGKLAYRVYLDNETREYLYWDAATDKPLLPVQVVKTDDGDSITEEYAVDPTNVTFSDPPDGSETLPQSAYVSWAKRNYNSKGQLASVDRYHDIPSSGAGSLVDDYHRTSYSYDAAGRKIREIQIIRKDGASGYAEQVTKLVYDGLERVIEVHRGVGDQNYTDYSTDPGTLEKVSARFYDEPTPGSGTAGVGDGLITSEVSYYDAENEANNVETIYRYNWRGQLRGVEPEAAPYIVYDVDFAGRTVATAQYQANVTWTGANSVLEDHDYAATVASDPSTAAKRGSLTMTCFDGLGRVYRTEVYGVTASTGATVAKIVTDNYHDRNSRLVGTATTARGAQEFAYDGAGRQTEERIVKALETTKYSGGAFQYRDPLPGGTSGGDDGVIQIVRTSYNKVDGVTDALTLEANHVKTDGTTANEDGLNLTAVSGNYDYIQQAVYNWYDGAHRLRTRAVHGTGASSWTHNSPSRPGGEPDYSGNDGVVTKYVHDGAGRLEQREVTDPATGNTYIVTKYTYDDLGRAVKLEEAEGSADERTTLTEYNGLSNVIRRIADIDNDDATFDNGVWTTDADDQITAYTFGDTHEASLVTKIQYPDGDTGTDNVQLSYDLDGRVATHTAQKHAGDDNATVITFDYDATFRRLVKHRVTTVGDGVDDAIRAIKTTYDSLGLVQKTTSYTDPSNEAAAYVANEIKYWYNALGTLEREYQEHAGVVDDDEAGGDDSLYVQYNCEDTVSGGVYTNAMRLKSIRYPNGRLVHYTYGSSGSIADLLMRIAAIKDDSGGSPGSTLAAYAYNGAGRLAVEDFEGPGVKLDYYGDTAGTYAGFDRYGRTKQQLWRDYGASADRDKYAYDYDSSSRRKYRENTTSAGKDELYSYDKLDRLTYGRRGDLNGTYDGMTTTNFRQDWSLSKVGNWDTFRTDSNGSDPWDTTQSRTHNDANETTAIGGVSTHVGYDARGNMTKAPVPGDEANHHYVCTYDAWNRLVKVTDDGGTPEDVASYSYDGVNRRIKKVDKTGVGDVTYDYYYNAGWQVLEVRKDGDADPLKQYVWSQRYIDAPVCRFRDSDTDGAGIETVYYLTDANMNVTCLTDANGDAVERYVYDPYGKVTVYDGSWANPGSSSSYDNDLLYCGYRHDTETGLYHVRHRMYHPTVGRWLQRDPLDYVDGFSLYEYVRSAPPGATDSYGLLYSCGSWGDVNPKTEKWIRTGSVTSGTNRCWGVWTWGRLQTRQCCWWFTNKLFTQSRWRLFKETRCWTPGTYDWRTKRCIAAPPVGAPTGWTSPPIS